MQYSKKGERKRRGRHRTTMPAKIEEMKEISPGKYEPIPSSGKEIEVVIPSEMSPVQFLESKTFAILSRIEGIALSGTPMDAVKLKADLALLNKVMPDITRQEVQITESPYERILRALNEKEKK